jgi:pilus assembly protein CpaE
VDTPPSFTEHVLAAIDLSDLTVLIATLEIPSVKNLRIAISTLDTLGAAPDARAIVLNRADVRVGLKASDVEAALREPIAASIPNSVSVPSATNRGVAIVIEEPKSPVALAIREVADREIRQRFGEVPQNGTRRSFSLMRSKK